MISCFCRHLASPEVKANIHRLEKKNAELWRRLEATFRRAKRAETQVAELIAAIETHKAALDDLEWVDESDLLLWSLLDEETGDPS